MNTPDPSSVTAATKAAPGLDPQSVVAAAMVGRSQQAAAGAASAAAMYGTTTTKAQQLAGLTQGQQRAVWNASSQAEQSQLLATGYTPPPAPISTQTKPSAGSGIMGDISGVLGTVGRAVGHAASDVLNATQAPLRAVQHLERAGHVLSEMGELAAGESPGAVAARARGAGVSTDTNDFRLLFSPSAWSQAWRETSNGEKTFDPAIANQLQRSSDPLDFSLAKQLASVPQGADTSAMENQIVNGYPQAQRLQIEQKLHSDPQVKTLVQQLQAAKISAGRDIVGQQFITQHPAVGNKLSGGIDAALDFAQDPTMRIGKAAKLADAAKWGIDAERAGMYGAGNATDWEAAVGNAYKAGAGRRFLESAASAINSGSSQKMSDLDPRLLNYAQQVLDDHASQGLSEVTADSLKNWYSSQAGMAAILSGKAAREANGAMILPHLSALGAAKVAAKGAFNNTVNFLAERNIDPQQMGKQLAQIGMHPSDLAATPPELLAQDGSLPADASQVATLTGNSVALQKKGGYLSSVLLAGPSAAARVIKQMTTLTASKPFLDLADPESVVELRKMLSYSLPSYAVDHVANVYLHTPDIDQRFAVAKGAIDQMLHLAGVYSGPDGARVGDQLMEAVDQSMHGEAYAPLGIDKYADGTRAAVFDSQVNHRVFLPSFREVHAAALQNAFLHSIRVPVDDLAQKFMSAWRAGVLYRIAFPIRTSVDENLGNALRNGAINAAKAQVVSRAARRAGNAAENAERVAQGLAPEYQGVARVAHLLTDHLPDQITDRIDTVRKFASATLGDAAWRATSPLKGDLGRNELWDAAGIVQDHVWDSAAPMVSALEHTGGGYDQGEDLLQMMKDGKPTYVRMRTGNTWSELLPSDGFARQKWRMALDTMAQSKLGQAVLEHMDEDNPAQVRAVMDVLADPDFAATKALMRRGRELPDQRFVGHGAIQQEVDHSFASKVVDALNASVRSGTNGPVIQPIVDAMKEGRAPDQAVLDEVKNSELPDSMFGPDIVPVSPVKSLVERGFRPLAATMDSLARQPIFLHSFARALRTTRPWAEKFTDDPEHAEELAAHLAAEQAMRSMKPFIHSPEIRSQFEMLHRTAMPFLFAQVQFAKRWAKTFLTNPDAIAKAQLGMNGLRTSGIVHTDQNGNEFFYYPGSQYVTDTLARAANAIGIPAWVPLSVPFTGQVKYIMPGINNPLTPSVGPTVAIPLKALTGRFPELQNVEQGLLGPGASNSYWEQITPSALSRVIHAISDNPDLPGQLSSATMQAMQQLQATGHGLAPDATTAQKQAYVDRVTNWARVMLFSKAILGFTAPASPTELFDPRNLNERLSTLMNELPYDQAITQFLAENPDASAYTVFASKSAGGATLPATVAAGKFLDQNQAFVQNYQLASGWLIPRTTGNQPFDSAVYREQIQEGLRDQKVPGLVDGQSQFLNDILIAPAAKQYYAAYQTEQKLLAGAKGDSTRTAQIRANYDQQKAQFLAQNPAFADSLTSADAKATREQTIWQLEQALTDPNVPKGPQTTHVATMVAQFVQYQRTDLALQGQTSSAASRVRTANKTSFETWAQSYADAHPDVSDLWSTLLQPEVSDTSVGLGSSQGAISLVDQVTQNRQALAGTTTAPITAPPPQAIANEQAYQQGVPA